MTTEVTLIKSDTACTRGAGVEVGDKVACRGRTKGLETKVALIRRQLKARRE